MQIIFLKDIPRIGKKYEIKEVANGYGRHLIVQKFAEAATKESVARIKEKQIIAGDLKKIHADILEKNLKVLSSTVITIHGKVNEKGHLFASIGKDEICTELKRVTHIVISSDSIILDRPIKEVGRYEILVVVGELRAKFIVEVVGTTRRYALGNSKPKA